MYYNPSISIVILNYNGISILNECLPSIENSCKYYNGDSEIILVDNGSSDDSLNYVKKNFVNIKIIESRANLLIAEGYNLGIFNACNEIIIILNNDMKVEQNFIIHLVKHFENDENLFSVTGKALNFDGITINGGWRDEKISFGLFTWDLKQHNQRDKGQLDKEKPVLITECTTAFSRKKLISLGGLDPLFPYMFQFVDLSYRAWKRGYYSKWEPQSTIYHKGNVTFSNEMKSRKGKFQMNIDKEYFLFMWKNFTDLDLVVKHILFLPFNMIRYIFIKRKSYGYFLIGFFEAIFQINVIYKKRKLERQFIVREDKQVFNILNKI